ncbi:MAG: TRAP transporter substrate-binding protein DctP [Gammaproteobacteria bacterium]|nr:TRAP transporter substrate-binding protein DctP [Gammaproteobacteria bacterium]MCW8986534.1 TRAP transporter substrate-binding protein DctP [Gammaproteobacteria bacterium]MCW9031035.1 TRAP transporter substrate-binding protein DctP [Gammaproteobacteria bacterium]
MKPKIMLLMLSALFLFSAATHAAVIKIATLSPDGTTWMKKMRAAAEEISTQTQDRVKIKFYPGGVMGNENAILRKMRINQLQGAAVSSGALDRYYNDASIYSMPFLFNSHDEAIYVRNKIDHLIVEGLEKGGLISFGFAESGFAYILSNSPIKDVAELRKQKAWIPDSESARQAATAFKFQPIPLPFSDVLAALQTSLVDTIASSPIAAIALQWHSQVKYLTEMPLLYGSGTLVISKKTMDKLKAADRAIVKNIMSKTFAEIDQQNQKDNIAALDALKTQGISFIKPDPKQLAEWKNLAQQGNVDLVAKGFNSKKMYNLVTQHISEYQKLK